MFSVRLARATHLCKDTFLRNLFLKNVSLCLMSGKHVNLMDEALEVILLKGFPPETVFDVSVCRLVCPGEMLPEHCYLQLFSCESRLTALRLAASAVQIYHNVGFHMKLFVTSRRVHKVSPRAPGTYNNYLIHVLIKKKKNYR